MFKRSLGADHSSALTLYKILPLYKALQWECHYVKAEKVNSVRISASCHNRSTLILFMKHIHFSLISRNPQTFSLLSLYVLYRYDADCISLFGFVTKTSFNVMGWCVSQTDWRGFLGGSFVLSKVAKNYSLHTDARMHGTHNSPSQSGLARLVSHILCPLPRRSVKFQISQTLISRFGSVE